MNTIWTKAKPRKVQTNPCDFFGIYEERRSL